MCVGCVRAACTEEVWAVGLHLGIGTFGIEFKVISVGLLIAFVSFTPLLFPLEDGQFWKAVSPTPHILYYLVMIYVLLWTDSL